MSRRLVRVVVASVLGLALWLAAPRARADVAPSARASARAGVGAPMCDFHAASVNAPAPTLETPQSATEISMSPDAAAVCDALPGLDARSPGRVHRAAPREAARAEDSACNLPAFALVPKQSSARLRGLVRTSGARPGVRDALDRPPRSV